jgi:hypothetical protein
MALEAARSQLLVQQVTQAAQGNQGAKSKTSWWRR